MIIMNYIESLLNVNIQMQNTPNPFIHLLIIQPFSVNILQLRKIIDKTQSTSYTFDSRQLLCN